MKDILVDTDVLIDLLFDNKPFSEAAATLFTLADNNKINLYISAISYCKLHEELSTYTTQHKMSAIFRMIFSVCNVIEVNTKVIQRALGTGITNFSKAIQYASALQNERISIIVTNNIADYKNSRIPVMNPSGYLKLVDNKVPDSISQKRS
jgi:predicted nucleic acid-binding protein